MESLQESDLDGSRGAVLVRRGQGGKRREVGLDRRAWEQLDPWLEIRCQLPPDRAWKCGRSGTARLRA